jgi:hypothetical protein
MLMRMSTKSELVGGEGEGGVIGAAAAARSGGGLMEMLTKLDLADKYLQKLESKKIDVGTLQGTLAIDGRAALLQLLEDAGVDKAGPHGKILRFPAADVCLSPFIFFQNPPFCQIRAPWGTLCWGTLCNDQSDYQDVWHAKLAPPPFFPRVTTKKPHTDTFSSLPFVKV